MTHNELLEMIAFDKAHHLRQALCAVVELHKPYKYEGRLNSYLRCSNCYSPDESEGNLYPCETIQAIEKELK